MSAIAAETMNAVQAQLDRRVAEGLAAGMVALVGRGDEAQAAAAGALSLGGAPMGRDAIFRIASLTKPIVAAAAMMLVEDGKLALGEPVDRLAPELANRRVLRRLDGPVDDTVPAARPITVEDLLTFRLGLGIVFGGPDQFPILGPIAEHRLVGFGPPDPSVTYGPDWWMLRLGELPLMAQPGERWLYNAGSDILGVLIARASGQSLPDFLRTRIFEPLAMKDTAFFVPPENIDRLAAAYRPSADGLGPYGPPPGEAWTRPPAFPSGDSGLVATADDMFAFSRFMLSGGLAGGSRLLSQASVAAMTRDHLTPEQRAGGAPILDAGQGWGYGVGVRVEAGDGPPAGAYGWNGGLGTSWVADPGSGVTAILMTQTAFTGPQDLAAHAELQRAAFSHS